SAQRQHPWLPLLAIALALLVTPLFAALGLATLTAPFILACWLIRAGIQMLGKASLAHESCAHEENHPRLR
ncbi:MAG: urea transporter, partial [Pseudomonas atacamensis]